MPKDHPLRREQVLYSIRSERMLMEQLDYNLVDGTLVEAWAGLKSFKRKDP